MTLRYEYPTDQSFQELKDAAARLHPAHSEIIGMLKQTAQSPLDSLPHPVYTVGLSAFTRTGSLSEAERVGRWYLQQSQGRHYAIEIQHDETELQQRFAGVHSSPFLPALRELLSSLAKVGVADYVPAIILIHAMGVCLLWLQAQDTKDSLFIAVPPLRSPLQPWPMTYTAEQIESELRNQAERLLPFDNTPKFYTTADSNSLSND